MCLIVVLSTAGCWLAGFYSSYLEGSVSTLHLVSGLVTDLHHEKLVDFDTHLNDITQDWLNPYITKIVQAASTSRQSHSLQN